jgi:hypothetical protein
VRYDNLQAISVSYSSEQIETLALQHGTAIAQFLAMQEEAEDACIWFLAYLAS